MKRPTRTVLAVASVPLLLGLAACSNADDDGDAGTFSDDGTVPAETVQSALEGFLSDNKVEGTIDSCEDIDDEVDATSTCTATIDDIEGEVGVTVSESTDTDTTFEFDLTEFGYKAQ